jgi:hypothetical protein
VSVQRQHSFAGQRVALFFLHRLLVSAREEINLHHEIEMGKINI